jgi:hypothetical protein
VNNFETTYIFDWVTRTGYVSTGAADTDIQSQLLSDWDQMAAAAGYGAPAAGMAAMMPPPMMAPPMPPPPTA